MQLCHDRFAFLITPELLATHNGLIALYTMSAYGCRHNALQHGHGIRRGMGFIEGCSILLNFVGLDLIGQGGWLGMWTGAWDLVGQRECEEHGTVI